MGAANSGKERQVETPEAEYRARLSERRSRLERMRRVDRRISVLRLAIFVAGALALWPALLSGTLRGAWLLLPVAGFGAAMVWHDRVIRRSRRAPRAVEFYEQGLRRVVEGEATGPDGLSRLDPTHDYADDLDLFVGDSCRLTKRRVVGRSIVAAVEMTRLDDNHLLDLRLEHTASSLALKRGIKRHEHLGY